MQFLTEKPSERCHIFGRFLITVVYCDSSECVTERLHVAGSVLTLSKLQAASSKLLIYCAQANSAFYPQRGRK